VDGAAKAFNGDHGGFRQVRISWAADTFVRLLMFHAWNASRIKTHEGLR